MALTHIHNMTDPTQFVPEEIAAGIIKDVRHSSAIMRVAKQVPQSTLVKTYNTRTSGPSGYWVDDYARKTADAAVWDQINMFAHEIAVIVPVKERDLIGNPLDVWSEIKEDIVEAFAITFDSAAMFGTSSPYNWSILQAIQNVSHFHEEGVGADLADDLNLALGSVEEHNYGPTATVTTRAIRPRLRGLRDDQDAPIFQAAMTRDMVDAVYGTDLVYYVDASSWPTGLTALTGDWSTVHYSIVEGISYKLLTEAALTTITDDGGVALSLAERDMVALRATMYAGFRPTKDAALAALVQHSYYQNLGTPDTELATP